MTRKYDDHSGLAYDEPDPPVFVHVSTPATGPSMSDIEKLLAENKRLHELLEKRINLSSALAEAMMHLSRYLKTPGEVTDSLWFGPQVSIGEIANRALAMFRVSACDSVVMNEIPNEMTQTYVPRDGK